MAGDIVVGVGGDGSGFQAARTAAREANMMQVPLLLGFGYEYDAMRPQGGSREEPGRRELTVAVLVAPGLVGLRLHLLEARRRIGHALLGDGRVDPGEELPLLDVVVEVDEELGDLSRDLGADADGREGLERPGRGDDRLQVSALDRREAKHG